MMKRVCLLAALAFGCAPAAAAVPDDVKTCVQSVHESEPAPLGQVKACTLAVNSGELDDRQLAMVLFARATLHVRSGSLDEARRDYTQAAMLNPSPGFVAFVKGAVARAEGNPSLTITALSEALSHSPDSVEMLVWRGDAFYMLGSAEEALRDFDRAHKLAPSLLAARIGRGVALISLGRAEEAVAPLDEARRQHPQNVAVLFALARARLDTGDILGAVAAARGAERQWPRDMALRFHVSRLHFVAGDWDGGLRRLERVAAPSAWLEFEVSLLRFLIARETSPTLSAAALVAIAEKPGTEAWHLPLAHLLASTFPARDRQEPYYPAVTVEQIVEAARERGRETWAWFYIGEALRVKGDRAGATTAFRHVLELGLIDTWEYRESRQRLHTLR
ncbi:MAG: tetratricopeptide repeat protein [Alphaproteobacteria bacterium]|nr:tetratricopeptide repeat protein [Alphaproteobacteria bacterium]MCW5744131.1 tetratricopeptide repeat protein [Alphaproteobacteria bacterium]